MPRAGGPYNLRCRLCRAVDEDELLGALFGHGARRRGEAGGAQFPHAGQRISMRGTAIDAGAVNNATKRVTLPDDATVDVTIPPGTRGGYACAAGARRYRRRGNSDLMVEGVSVGEHRHYKRRDDICSTCP